jgi:hypothetical protein
VENTVLEKALKQLYVTLNVNIKIRNTKKGLNMNRTYCDKLHLYESLCINYGDNLENIDFKNLHIFLDGSPVEARIDCVKDLVPFFGCIPSVTISQKTNNGEKRELFIHTSSKPYYFKQEEDTMNMYLDEVKKHWRRIKRTVEPAYREMALKAHFEESAFYPRKEFMNELCDRVIAKGDKATTEDLTYPMFDRYKQNLYETMIEYGWSEYKAYEWCYGWKYAYKHFGMIGKDDGE